MCVFTRLGNFEFSLLMNGQVIDLSSVRVDDDYEIILQFSNLTDPTL